MAFYKPVGRLTQHPSYTDVASGDAHIADLLERLPEVLVGGANGKHVGGKNLVLPEKTPLANLHLTMLEKLGIPQPSFGNSTGVLSDV